MMMIYLVWFAKWQKQFKFMCDGAKRWPKINWQFWIFTEHFIFRLCKKTTFSFNTGKMVHKSIENDNKNKLFDEETSIYLQNIIFWPINKKINQNQNPKKLAVLFCVSVHVQCSLFTIWWLKFFSFKQKLKMNRLFHLVIVLCECSLFSSFYFTLFSVFIWNFNKNSICVRL